MKNYPILELKNTSSIEEFISFWSKQYHFTNMDFYTQNINKDQFTADDILELYTWKNGMRLSTQKVNSIQEKVIPKLDIINKLKQDSTPNLDFFLQEFKSLSFVWKIFLLHIISPETYPMYDQHIHRTFCFLHPDNPRILNAKQHELYFDYYLDFIKNEEIKDIREMDKAFFAFGQFINTKQYISLVK
ncbi:hypothetical protein NMK71_01640 [Weeksellaceae bacterium KMM 9713]|uniref:Uncharacterized protein n=1 Tax=Profundicola chukchiensis TaxID=2961959 RepID=A0A9X4RWY4_9FLAO|nr:hypothetical protein [Profundicola chukchiensis]MDG4945104.1 hypothetical protein [Profundicola chukchiensis]